MRAREFLREAVLSGSTITSWPGYLEKLLNSTNISLGAQGEKGQNLALRPESQEVVQQAIDYFRTNAITPADAKHLSGLPITFTDGTTATLGQIFKSAELKGTSEERAEIRSKGLVAEALLGVAMYAKLIARGGELTEQVTDQDVWSIVDRINPQGAETLTDSVNDVNNKVSDNINLEINLAIDVQHLLTDPKYRPMFIDTVSSWVKYVNDSLAQRYSDALYKNNRPDSITIKLAGLEGGKVDVLINVLNAKGQATRKMDQVKLSVKLSDSLIGQVARGKTFDEVYDNLENLFSPLGVKLAGKKKAIVNAAMKSGVQNQFVNAMSIAYKEAVADLKKIAKTPAGDAKLAERVSELLSWHATNNDPDVQVIEKLPGADYRILNYKDLKTVFKKNNINIAVEYQATASSKMVGAEIPRILIYDKNNPTKSGRLLEIRFRARGNYANHIIEPGPLLKELAAYNRFTKSN